MFVRFSEEQFDLVTGVSDSWSPGKAVHNLDGVTLAGLCAVLPNPILARQWHSQCAAEFRIGTGRLVPSIAAVGGLDTAGQRSSSVAVDNFDFDS